MVCTLWKLHTATSASAGRCLRCQLLSLRPPALMHSSQHQRNLSETKTGVHKAEGESFCQRDSPSETRRWTPLDGALFSSVRDLDRQGCPDREGCPAWQSFQQAVQHRSPGCCFPSGLTSRWDTTACWRWGCMGMRREDTQHEAGCFYFANLRAGRSASQSRPRAG